jgi:hypothetical protein
MDGWRVNGRIEGLMDGQMERKVIDRPVLSFSNNLLILIPLYPLTHINLPYRLAQLRESGVQFRIRQHYLPAMQPDTEPSSVSVRLVTVGPILVLLAAGNVIGLLIFLIEQFVHRYVFQTCPARIM